jgi:CHAD domain-containing protein
VPSAGAALATAVALAAGVALARAGRGRLAATRETPDLALLPGEPLEQGLKRMALEQLDLVLGQLTASNGAAPDEEAVHEMRKALKRLRSLLRLLETSLGKQALARETEQLRAVARSLAGARDSKVMLDTLDGLIERHPRKLGASTEVARLREHLAQEHASIRAHTVGDASTRSHALGELRVAHARIAAWQLPAAGELELAEPGLLRLYSQGRARLRVAARQKGEPSTVAMHEWRKRVKDLRYTAEMLQHAERAQRPALPGPAGRHAKRRRSAARRQAKLLRGVARAADELAEVLGEDHDLAVLGEIVRAHTRGSARPRLRRRTRRRLEKAIHARRHELRRRALRDGERLYALSPKKFLRRVREAAGA